MGFRNESKPEGDHVYIPTLDDIAKMAPSHLRFERIRLKNEISFRRGDYGGPDHKAEIKNLNTLIEAIEARMKEVNGKD